MRTVTTPVSVTRELASFLVNLRFEQLPHSVVERTEDLFLNCFNPHRSLATF